MAEKRSVYISSQALSMPRRLDSLSGRINQALERYAWIVASEEARMRDAFSDCWPQIVEMASGWRRIPADELGREVRFDLDDAGIGPRGMRHLDLVLLADIAEGEL